MSEPTSSADLSLPGMLLTWMSIDSTCEDDFNRWYDREHLEERLRIPGFESSARYECPLGLRRYLGLYRTRSLSVFETTTYRNAFQHQTPWSVANLARMQHAMRRVCVIAAEAGAGTGAWLGLLRLGTASVDRPAIRSLTAEIASYDRIVAARLLIPDPQLSTPLPAEVVPGRVLDPLLLIEASSEAGVAAASRRAAMVLGIGPQATSILQLMWQLRRTDLHD